jgi:hypothetical protein
MAAAFAFAGAIAFFIVGDWRWGLALLVGSGLIGREALLKVRAGNWP